MPIIAEAMRLAVRASPRRSREGLGAGVERLEVQ